MPMPNMAKTVNSTRQWSSKFAFTVLHVIVVAPFASILCLVLIYGSVYTNYQTVHTYWVLWSNPAFPIDQNAANGFSFAFGFALLIFMFVIIFRDMSGFYGKHNGTSSMGKTEEEWTIKDFGFFLIKNIDHGFTIGGIIFSIVANAVGILSLQHWTLPPTDSKVWGILACDLVFAAFWDYFAYAITMHTLSMIVHGMNKSGKWLPVVQRPNYVEVNMEKPIPGIGAGPARPAIQAQQPKQAPMIKKSKIGEEQIFDMPTRAMPQGSPKVSRMPAMPMRNQPAGRVADEAITGEFMTVE